MELEDLKTIIEMLKESDITDLQIERDDYKLRLKREKIMASIDLSRTLQHAPQVEQAAPVAASATPAQKADSPEARGLVTVTAPLVGTFYRAATPDASNFVEVGDRVRKGQVLCIVEAMKLMNEIECEVGGVIVNCLVENAQAVEYGEPLFLVDPD